MRLRKSFSYERAPFKSFWMRTDLSYSDTPAHNSWDAPAQTILDRAIASYF